MQMKQIAHWGHFVVTADYKVQVLHVPIHIASIARTAR